MFLSSSSSKPLHTSLKFPLSGRGCIDRMDAGLRSIRGAQEIISMISSRRIVTKLILGHNELADDGCIVLFKFLGSAVGQKYPIAEISLNSNGIGDRGLLAIATYLKDNTTLKELFLQNNKFAGDSSTTSTFANALNTSHLRLLSLTTNRNLSDTFLQTFLPALSSPHLREIHLSAISLSPLSAQPLMEYLSSERCHLHTLKCNGNALGLRAVRYIIRAIERRNFALLTAELYSNYLMQNDHTSDTEEDNDIGPDAWKECEKVLRRVLLRNEHLKRATEKEAVQLLRYTRILLHSRTVDTTKLKPTPTPRPTLCSDSRPCTFQCPSASEPRSGNSTISSTIKTGSFPYTFLPTELQLYILSFLAPTLSFAQRIRIYEYASSLATLPPMLPCLPSGNDAKAWVCLPDPSSLGFGSRADNATRGRGCLAGKCMGAGGSVVCHREEERGRWLRAVGCCDFEPEGYAI